MGMCGRIMQISVLLCMFDIFHNENEDSSNDGCSQVFIGKLAEEYRLFLHLFCLHFLIYRLIIVT